jgi:hypothetical protein
MQRLLVVSGAEVGRSFQPGQSTGEHVQRSGDDLFLGPI